MPAHSYIEITLDDPHATFKPGDSISGTVTLNSVGVVKASALYVSLCGVCTTRVRSGRPVSGYGGHKSQSESIEFLRLVTEIQEISVFSPGEYSWPFSILVPGNCINARANLESKGLDSSWTTTPLPTAQQSTTASIKYFLNGVCKQQELLSRAIKTAVEVPIVSLAASHHQLLSQVQTMNRCTLKFFDRPQESWAQWSKRLIGVDTKTDKTEVEVGLEAAQSILHGSDPVDCIKRLTVTAARPDFEVRDLTIRVIYKMQVVARLYISELTETHAIYHDPHVQVAKDGSLLPLHDSCRTGEFSALVSECTPNWTTDAYLEVALVVQPVSGSPIIPVRIVERTCVSVYYGESG